MCHDQTRNIDRIVGQPLQKWKNTMGPQQLLVNQPIFSEFRPENMGVIWAARSCFHVYWKNKSIVFVGSCHQLQSRRKLSFGLQEDLKIYLFRPICTWSKSGARMEHHISVDFFSVFRCIFWSLPYPGRNLLHRVQHHCRVDHLLLVNLPHPSRCVDPYWSINSTAVEWCQLQPGLAATPAVTATARIWCSTNGWTFGDFCRRAPGGAQGIFEINKHARCRSWKEMQEF